jgi:hypothetical protein
MSITIPYEDFAALAKTAINVNFIYAPAEPNLVVFVEGQIGKVFLNLARLIDFGIDTTGTDLLAGGVYGGALLPLSVSGSKLLPGSADAFLIGSHTIQTSNMVFFVSGELTATGTEQDVAHNFALVPTYVAVVPTDLSPSVAGVFTVTEGAHDATNCKVTVTSGKKFKVLAWV